jgi:hypothetical protein
MPSLSYRRWRTARARSLDEIAEAHAVVGGPARGRRFATQQLNRAYAVLIASHFQGFCRDLHSECVDHILTVTAPPMAILPLLREDMVRGRQLDRGNAQPGSLGADFRRFGIDLWGELAHLHPDADQWKKRLELLNDWRNAIVHEDFTSPKLSGIMTLRLVVVRRWRVACARLARAMDEVARLKMLSLTGAPPW